MRVLKKIALLISFLMVFTFPLAAKKGEKEEVKLDVNMTITDGVVGDGKELPVASQVYPLVYWQKIEKEREPNYFNRVNNFSRKIDDIFNDIEDYVKKDLKLSYGGTDEQLESMNHGKTKCYGISLLVQDILAKEGIESSILMLGYNRGGKYKIPVRLYNPDTDSKYTINTIGHAILLIKLEDKIKLVSPTAFLLKNTRDFEPEGKDEKELITRALIHYNVSDKFYAPPDKLTALILPTLSGKNYRLYEVSYKEILEKSKILENNFKIF